MQYRTFAIIQTLSAALTLPGTADAQQAPQKDQRLPEVKVQASTDVPGALPQPYAGGQVARGGRLGLLGNTDVMDVPFSITSYTEQTIRDQQARSISDVLANDPSVRLGSAYTNINEDFTIRGFLVQSADIALNGMYGLAPYWRVPVEMAERVELLRGPSALLNGMPPSGNIGGTINVVPKRAGEQPMARITATYASDSIPGTHVDVSRRFGKSRELGIRVNTAYRSGDTTLDRQKQEDIVGVLALDYRNERLRVTFDSINQRQDITGVVRQFSAGPGLTAIPAAPKNTLNYPGYGYSETNDHSGVLRAEYDVSPALMLYGGYGRRKNHLDAVAGNPALLNTAGDFTSTPAWQVSKIESESAEAGAHVRFETGPVRHQLAIGATRVSEDYDIYFLFAGLAPPRNSNIYNPTYLPGPTTAGFAANLVPFRDTELTSYAIADTASFLDDKVAVTLGLRHQTVERQGYNFVTGLPTGPRYDEDAVTPVAGIVVKPMPMLSLYANYVEGLAPGPSAPVGTLNAGEVFAPFRSRQHEIGAKYDWGRMLTSISLFEIRQPSAYTSGGIFGVSGQQRNRGLELSLFGEVARGVRLMGGMAYTHAELTKTATPAFTGNDAVAVPRTRINFGAEWDPQSLPGVTLSGRVVYTGHQFMDQANVLRLPDWTRFDLGARYATRIAGRAVVFRANLENAFEKSYWGLLEYGSGFGGNLYIGAPRTLLLSASADF